LDAPAASDAPSSDTPASDAPTSDAATELVPGTLDVTWMHGSRNCRDNTDPEIQVHAYNATTYILRQNKCDTFEAPFIYVLIGRDSALSLDTGATQTTTLRDTIRGLIGTRPLLAAHSHAHGDHVAGDDRFRGDPRTEVVANRVGSQQAAFAITAWPDTLGHKDLGDRPLDVIAIPGHEQTHIAIYDRQTGLLLTGDSLYPGLLFIPDWTAYRASIRRLAQFAATRPIRHVLGAHVEMTRTPKVVYPYGTIFQPDEHVLQLSASHLVELDAALEALGATPPPRPVAHDDFIINPT
ncbi:MAG: MBL fold metallo-hydrolase, partial [Myxococcales bacterium]|nr:MBL fold metallo-hydrolase [Myxococcales bacterium]